jgi:signal transduction histidine kinase
LLTDKAEHMGVRMAPSFGRRSRSTGHPPTPPTWLQRGDLLILPIVFVVDVLLFSRLLRIDDVDNATRVAIVCYSAVGLCLLVFRRLAPVLVFCAVWVHSMLALLFTDAYIPVLLLLVALEMVAELRSQTVSLAALASLVLPTTLLVTAAAGAASSQSVLTAAIGSVVFYLVIDILAWGIGRWVRRNRLRMAHLQEQHILQVQQQREAAENAVSAERLRIARELHDIVAHSVTIMVLHAAGASRVVDTDPARAKEALGTIEESGQQAMGELRRLLELLRENEGDPPRSGSPLPGLQQIAQTISSVRASGVAVTFEARGEARRLDTSVDLAAYRLVQEALTNVTKHRGAGAHATVTIDWGVDNLTVAVVDDGGADAQESIIGATAARASSLSTGNGLAGLRERIAIAGGEFVAAPTDTGGFRVAARLPVSVLSTGVAGVTAQQDGHAGLPGTDGRRPAGTPLAWIDP